jgi:ubiquinone/menaquinone biosynthesis C-methylase UbiE/chromosome segregation ATPase
MSDLEQTGERFHPEMRGVIRYEHLHRYALCLDMVAGLDVLDIACGEGYGSALLASRAKRVTGVDLETRAIEHARRTYYHPNVRFLAGDCVAIPAADDAFDVVVSFETLEHVDQQDQMLSEIRRVLRPGGRLVISSPNKLVYSDEVQFTNPYHVRELYYDEFLRLLERHFPCIRVHGQRLAAASFVFPLVERLRGGLASYAANGGEGLEGFGPLERPLYFIAVCGEEEAGLGAIDSLFLDAHDDVLQVLQHEHQRALQQISAQHHALAERSRAAETLVQAEPLRLEPAREDAATPDADALRAERDSLQTALETLRNDFHDLRAERDAASALRHTERAELEQLRAERHLQPVGDAVAERDAIAADRDSIAAHRDAITADRESIAAHRDELARHSAALEQERDAALRAAEKAEHARAALEADRVAFSAKLGDALAERTALTADVARLVAERAGRLLALAARAGARDGLVLDRSALIAERESWVADRSASEERRVRAEETAASATAAASVAERDRAEIQADRARVQRRADALLRELESLRERLDGYQRQLAESTGHYEALRDAHEALRAAHEGLFVSKSWKVTAPLRALANTVRRKPQP